MWQYPSYRQAEELADYLAATTLLFLIYIREFKGKICERGTEYVMGGSSYGQAWAVVVNATSRGILASNCRTKLWSGRMVP